MSFPLVSTRYMDDLERNDVISGVSLLSPTTSGHFPVTSVVMMSLPVVMRIANVLERYNVISGVSLLSSTTSGHFPVVMSSLPVDMRTF